MASVAGVANFIAILVVIPFGSYLDRLGTQLKCVSKSVRLRREVKWVS